MPRQPVVVQVSVRVQGSPSSQPEPSPVALQTPATHTSTVHATASAVQGVPLSLGCPSHESETSLQTAMRHALEADEQSRAWPKQVPCEHASATVQKRPSSHGVALAAGA